MMKKRVIALMGAVLMLAALVLPCAAADDDSVQTTFYDETTNLDVLDLVSYQDMSIITIKNAVISYVTLAGVTGSVEYEYIVVELNGGLDVKGYSKGGVSAHGISSCAKIQYSSGAYAGLFAYDPPGIMGVQKQCQSISFSYFPSDVVSCVYEYANAFGFLGIDRFGPDAINQAYRNGYDLGYSDGLKDGISLDYKTGFADGVASIDQNAIMQEGHNIGYNAGFVDGAASVDTDAYYQNGYDAGYGLGYDDALGDFATDMDNPLRDAYWIRAQWTLTNGASQVLNFVDSNCGTVLISPPTSSSNLPITDFFYSSFYGNGNFNVSAMIEYYDAENLIDGDMVYITEFQMTFYFNDFMNSRDYDFSMIGTSNSTMYSMLFDYYNSDLSEVATVTETENDNDFNLRQISFEDGEKFIAFAFICDKPGAQILGKYGPMQCDDFGFVFSSVGDYDDGYADGLVTGLRASNDDAYRSGYEYGEDVGYSNGFTAGKREGLTITENGDWRDLMLSVVEAPINTFQSLFNFEILGLDMRAAFGAILTVCVLLIVVKKVVL